MRRGVAIVFVGLAGLVFGAAACSHGTTPGHIKCTSKSFVDLLGTCQLHYSDCADMKVYDVSCANDVCVCSVDGKDNGTKGADCPSDAGEANFDCGFDITD
ncbi:MAG: hypothetical protein U0414_20150 [Polyangiaceae bacterium]